MHKRRRSVTYDMWRRRKTRTYLLTYKHNTQVGAQPSTAPVNATLLAFCEQHRPHCRSNWTDISCRGAPCSKPAARCCSGRRDRQTDAWTPDHYKVLFKLAVTVHQCLNGRICRSNASRSPVLTRGGICVPPTVTNLPYRVSGSTLTAVGRSQLLARWPGTHSRVLSGIQRAAQTVSGIYLYLFVRTCSRVTSASSALGVLNDNALYKSTHSLTHSLTHSHRPCSAHYVNSANNTTQS